MVVLVATTPGGILFPRGSDPPCERTLPVMSAPLTLVTLKKVSVRAGAIRILQDVSLTVDAGDAIGISGPNGAGKTTLLRLIATLQPPANGVCSVLGVDSSTSHRYDVRNRIGYVGHTPGLYSELTLLENLKFVADARGMDSVTATDALDLVGLGGAALRRADHCSYGMQRRAEFARIIMTKPELLLLDEPHSALDSSAIELVDELVDRTVDSGGAVVLATHDIDRVAALVTSTHEIKDGRLL
jgi:heme exporter protein A